jgi:hypothetical protein
MFEQKTAWSKTKFLRFLRNQGKLSAGESVKPVLKQELRTDIIKSILEH